MDLVLYALVSISYPVVISFRYLHCTYPDVRFVWFNPAVVVRYTFCSSCGTLYGICGVDVCFIRCFVYYMSISYLSSLYTNGWLPDMNGYELHDRRWASTEQNELRTENERTTNGEWLVGCPFAILNMHKTPQWILRGTSPDINMHVTEKTDVNGWVPDDQLIAMNGIRYSSVLLIHWYYSVTWA